MQERATMSNIPRLEFWLDVINVGVAISLAASFVFGVASIGLSRHLGKIKDTQSAAEKVASDEKIAAANAEAAKAIEGVSDSQEKIAGLNKEAEALRAEAEKAKAERAEADRQIAIAKANAATASVRVEEEARLRADAERKNAEAQLALKKYLDEVAERQKDRHLSDEQRAKLIESLQGEPNSVIMIHCPKDSIEPCVYAHELSDAFEKAGWHVAGVMDVLHGTHPIGFSMRANRRDMGIANKIILALHSIGYKPSEIRPPDWDENNQLPRITLFVGFKP